MRININVGNFECKDLKRIKFNIKVCTENCSVQKKIVSYFKIRNKMNNNLIMSDRKYLKIKNKSFNYSCYKNTNYIEVWNAKSAKIKKPQLTKIISKSL